MKRVLHVLRKLDPGGIELWLLDIVQSGGLPGYGIEILVETEEPGKLEEGFLAAKVPIHRWRPGSLGRLYHLLRGFDAVHSHVHFFSGAILAVAAAARVPIRIAHSHTRNERMSGFYEYAMRQLLQWFATHRLAVSSVAASCLFGSEKSVDVVPCARKLPELSPHRGEAAVLGHVGRLAPEKNHALLERLLDLAPEFRLLLCGDGPSRERLERHPRIEFATQPGEVFSRSSCFVFPSWREGLGLAVIEAQAAGLPCLISNRIPREACLVPELITELDPGAPAERWAEVAREQSRRKRLSGALERVRASGYSLEKSKSRLAEIYASA